MNKYWLSPDTSEIPCTICQSVGWSDWLLLPHSLFNSVAKEDGYICFKCFAMKANTQIMKDGTGSTIDPNKVK